jgi:glycogen operon protein
MFPGCPIRAITNGMHPATWVNPALTGPFDGIGPHWGTNRRPWCARDRPADALLAAHCEAEAALMAGIRRRVGVTLDPDRPADAGASASAATAAVAVAGAGGVPANWQQSEGTPAPLGATWIPGEDAFNFALYSKHATTVTLLLYGPVDMTNPVVIRPLDHLRHKTGRVWHCRVPAAELSGATTYAYRVDGPRAPEQGHRFDRDKILLDPSARAIVFPPGFSREACRLPGPNPGRAPLGVLGPMRAAFDWCGDRRPRHTNDLVIYELHVRGFTNRANSGVPPDRRGTFAGLAEKIPYLQHLGVTAVELLPVFQFDPLDGNYWGYMPMSFFALHQAYGRAHGGGEEIDEFRTLVKALHAAEIEVILDVVYNHTAEADESGPTYGFRGIDNSTYYLLEDDRRRYRNDSGTGNVLHTANRQVQAMVMESLRYWVRECHVDGFRFDLASLFTRAGDGSINLDDPPIISAIQSDPDLRDVRLIAEAWDLSSDQLGRTFPGITWLQWNGRFRDQVRSAVRGDPDLVGPLMTRLYGSDDLFPDTLEAAYHPFQSVNCVTTHDGFCLWDLVSYDRKHNEANGHANEDGTAENRSWNCGWEGDVGVPDTIVALRKRQARNFMALLMLANGTPMIVAGDEFLHTQGGNNNPYNQDNETTWLDWDRLRRNADFFRFCRLLIAFRKRHATLGRSRFWREDVVWYGPGGPVRFDPADHAFALFLSGASQADQDLYVMVNFGIDDHVFTLQAPGCWQRVVDTALEPPDDIVEPGAEGALADGPYTVRGRSIVVLVAANVRTR